jgi:exopolyphosphatase / guanosine-5'-triphosphate,3'-diphosphate pyrophosphatase
VEKIAIIDLGTNTFQLLISEISSENTFTALHEGSFPAKIGKGGISSGIITDEGIQRAINGLNYFKEKLSEYAVPSEKTLLFATSAVRNATNSKEFCEAIFEATGLTIKVISGEEEAKLIYEGVNFGKSIGLQPSLICDIGGGSVEFIICNKKRVYWQQSFEIGGQRLMDKFMTTDPILPQSVESMMLYFENQLLPLTNAVHQYAPEILIGSAGSFETLIDMYYQKQFGKFPEPHENSFDLPKEEFTDSFRKLLNSNRTQRMSLDGMIELRVDMIVVGVCLIHFLLKRYNIEQIKVSTYALKEGVLSGLIAP